MDWFSWLSRTNLELTLVYDYGVVFACNELNAEDIPHFDHEFLQSMGITVAKHRLEILKLARSEARSKASNVSGWVREALNRTKRKVVDCAKTMMKLQQKTPKMAVKYQRGGGQRKEMDEQGKGEVFMLTHHSHDEQRGTKSLGFRSPRPRMMRSGPLERSNFQARIINRGHSGPLALSDWFPEKSGVCASRNSPLLPLSPTMCRSPRVAEGTDGIDSFWAKLFQDMKPT